MSKKFEYKQSFPKPKNNSNKLPVLKVDYPKEELAGWKRKYSQFMLIWAVISHVWLLIQAIEIYITKNVEGVSLPAFILLLCSAVIWFVYGFFVLKEKNYVISVSSGVSATLSTVVIAGIIAYKK